MVSCCLVGMEFQLVKMKKVLDMDGGDGCTTIYMNCTFKNG